MHIFSVSQFIEFLNAAFTSAVFPEGVTIEGEVADYRVSQKKWIWFKLKDETSVVSCFATVWQLKQPLEDGMLIRVFGHPKVHDKSGRFSVVVDQVQLVGEGALRRSFELLKKKLEKEGLFDVARKRIPPRFPERIGLIASRESAAYTDFIRILGNRWGGVDVSLAHVQVQGRDAVGSIVGAFRYFNDGPATVDVIVLTRGGGSLEDLQAFNSEDVARAVFSSKIPVVVGVGHERDETLADYVSDVRASTPSNAAEMVVPDREDIVARVDQGVRLMESSLRRSLSSWKAAIDRMASALLLHAERGSREFGSMLHELSRRFLVFAGRLDKERMATEVIARRLQDTAGAWIRRLQDELRMKKRVLASLDPMRILEKGYAIVRKDGRPVRDAGKVDIADMVDVQLYRGRIRAEVTEKS